MRSVGCVLCECVYSACAVSVRGPVRRAQEHGHILGTVLDGSLKVLVQLEDLVWRAAVGIGEVNIASVPPYLHSGRRLPIVSTDDNDAGELHSSSEALSKSIST